MFDPIAYQKKWKVDHPDYMRVYGSEYRSIPEVSNVKPKKKDQDTHRECLLGDDDPSQLI